MILKVSPAQSLCDSVTCPWAVTSHLGCTENWGNSADLHSWQSEKQWPFHLSIQMLSTLKRKLNYISSPIIEPCKETELEDLHMMLLCKSLPRGGDVVWGGRSLDFDKSHANLKHRQEIINTGYRLGKCKKSSQCFPCLWISICTEKLWPVVGQVKTRPHPICTSEVQISSSLEKQTMSRGQQYLKVKEL